MPKLGVMQSKDLAKRALLAVGVACFAAALCGCGPTVMSHAERRSPDGKFLATVRSELIGPGFGQDLPQTIVEIQSEYRNLPKTVLLLTHEYPTIPVSLIWRSSNELVIEYSLNRSPDDSVTVAFQATKWADVAISVRQVAQVR
jgi:hypothetical protein